MAATGKTPILLYGSTTATNVPVAGNLTNSSDGCEIAINVADKNLFFKDSTNTVNTVPIRQSSASSDGWLSSTDWTTFNGKVSSQWTTSGSNIYYTTGGVGVGTNSPAALLEIAASNNGSASPSTANNRLRLSDTDTTIQSGQPIGVIEFYSADATAPGAGVKAYIASLAESTAPQAALVFATDALTGTPTERMRIDSVGGVTVSTGNLVIGTSGKGIDFSATPNTGTSELLADYEEGTWTPTFVATTGSITSYTSSGYYRKIGSVVVVWAYASVTNNGTGSGRAYFGNMPFTPASTTLGGAGYIGSGYNTSSGKQLLSRATSGGTIDVANYDGTYPAGTGQAITVCATYYV